MQFCVILKLVHPEQITHYTALTTFLFKRVMRHAIKALAEEITLFD